MTQLSLDQLEKGKRGRIKDVLGEDGISIRLMEMGLITGEEIEFVGSAPLGEPSTFLTRGFRLALRFEESRRVQIEAVT